MFWFFATKPIRDHLIASRYEENGTQTDMMERDMMERDLAPEEVDYFKSMKITYTAIRRGQSEQRQHFTEVKEELLDNLVANIKARFPQVDLFTAMQIFEPASYPAVEEKKLLTWGNQHLETLFNFYGKERTNEEGLRFPSMVDSAECLAEFLPFKRLVMRNKGEQQLGDDGKEHFHYYKPPELIQKLFGNTGPERQNQEIYPAMF